MKEGKICIYPGCIIESMHSSRYCREHYLQRKREQAREKYLQQGRYKYKCICEMCGKEFEGARKTSRFCSNECYHNYSRLNSSDATHNYVRVPGESVDTHRRIAEERLNRKLGYNEVVHHRDCNPTNNILTNLIVLSRQDHIRLHLKLKDEKLKFINSCHDEHSLVWDILQQELTDQWLHDNCVPVIYLHKFDNNMPA